MPALTPRGAALVSIYPPGLRNYQYNRQLTFNTTATGANVASTLSWFPVCVAVNTTSWGTTAANHFFITANTNGKRVQFYDSTGRNLAYEVESYDATNKTAIYWVAIPSLAGNSTTTITVGYGNDPNGTDQDNRTSVWDANFRGVWHLGGNSWDGSAPEATNSAGSVNGTNAGTTDVAGQVGRGRTFNGTTQYVNFGNNINLGSGPRTVSIWANPSTSLTTDGILMGKMVYGGNYTGWTLYRSLGTSAWRMDVNSNANTGAYRNSYAGTATLGTWKHVAGVYDGAEVTVYENGVAPTQTRTGTATAYNTDNTVDLQLGRMTSVSYLNGSLDEARLSAIARSADWIRAEYYSMGSTSWVGDGWMTIGSELAVPQWVSPSDGSAILVGTPLVWKSVNLGASAHYNLQTDVASSFTSPNDYRSDRGGFEYWAGGGWAVVPSAGVPAGVMSPYPYWRTVSINTTATGANITSTLTSFPICVVVNSSSWTDATERSNFFGTWNVGGKRVRFVDSTGSSLAYEVESYDSSGQSAVYWVNVPTIAGNSTTNIYLGYGADPHNVNQDAATSVWDSNHKGVYHLNGSTLSVADATGTNNLTNSGATATTGQVDGGGDFTGATAAATKASPTGIDTNTYTVSFWAKIVDTTNGHNLVARGNSGTAGQLAIQYGGTGGGVADATKVFVDVPWVKGNILTITNGLTRTDWNHIVLTRNGSAWAFYTQGAANGTATDATAATYAGSLRLGYFTSTTNGYLDEVRISASVRSADWVKAEYFSMKSTAWPGDGWLTFGTQQAVSGNVRLSTTLPSGQTYARVRQSKFTPLQISGLHSWYDAADTSTITSSGGLVSQWNDKSGNGRHATQATSTLQPTTGALTLNGNNVVSAPSATSGSGKGLRASASLTSNALTAFVIASKTGAGGTANVYDRFLSFRGGNDYGSTNGFCAFYTTQTFSSVTPPAVHVYRNSAAVTGQRLTYGAANLEVVVLDGSNVSLTHNGVKTTGTTSATAVNSTEQGLLSNFGNVNDTNDSALYGYIAEHIVYTRVLSDAEIALVVAYLKSKWNV